MKIVRKGNPVECKTCQSILEYEGKDVSVEYINGFKAKILGFLGLPDLGVFRIQKITCPVCKTELIINIERES